MSIENIPWKQQPNEPDYQYQAFKNYLEYGPARSYRQTGLVFSRTKRTIINWSNKWNWAERLKCYEVWMAENIHALIFEFIKKLEIEKYLFKINQSRLTFNAAKVMQRHFDNFENSAQVQTIKGQMNFLKFMTKTINALLDSADFSITKNFQYQLYGTDCIPKIEEKNSNNDSLELVNKDRELFAHLHDILSQLADDSNAQEGEIGETNFKKLDKYFKDNN